MSAARISLHIVVFKLVHGVWRRRREAASASFSAALYSVYSGLYSEAMVSSAASAVASAEVERFREAVQYVQRAAKALYEAAKDVFEHVKITVQRLVELFVEAVTLMLAWVDEHKAYLFLMIAVAAGVIALSVALNLWGLVEMEKLAHAASAPFVAGLVDAGGRAAERFGALAEGYERWKMEEKVISEIINAPLNGERPFSKLTSLENLPKPLVELRRALKDVKDEAEKDAAVVTALVLYKTLVKNAGAYREWAGWYKWARGLVEKQAFTVAAGDIERLRGAQRRLEEAAEEVRRELNAVLALYASHSRDLYEKLKPHLEVDVEKAEELAVAKSGELGRYSNATMGTKTYAALLSVARGGIYGHAAILLMGEGALVDIVLLTPRSAYDNAKDVAKKRGEAVDPSRSPKGAVDWEDRAASTLLRFLAGYGKADLKFRLVEKGGRKGFQMFRTFGGIEAPVGELWMGKTTVYFKVSREWLSRLVEEAKETAPDLSGLDTAPQYLAWRATDVSTVGRQIVGATVHSWQLRWYFGPLGGPDLLSGGADVTKEGIKFLITTHWPREREDQILRESRWLESLLSRRVESWRELVDAIDWSWVLKRVEGLVDELKTWIGPEKMGDAEREELVRRMLGELALLAHFAEARKVKNDKQKKKESAERLAKARKDMDDDEWRAERAVRLAKAVEALSGGRITGEYAERLAKLVIRYAEGRKKETERGIENLVKELAGVSREEVWSVVKRVLSGEDPYTYCLARDCADDRIVRKFVAPALELVMLDKALRGELDRERVKLRFGEMYATAVAGDGSVGPGEVELAVGGELGGGAALLRLAALHLLNRLLPDELKFGVQVYVGEGRYYNITATSENATRLMRLLAVTAPSAGGKYLSDKFKKFVEAAKVEVQLGNIWLTDKGHVAAYLTISEACVTVKYNVYLLKHDIRLQFQSTDRSRAELAALLLRHAGVSAEVKKKKDRNVWQVWATTDMLAAGREELRDAVRKVVEEALEEGWVDEENARRWLEKLEGGVATWEGKKFKTRLVKGALEVGFSSADRESLEDVADAFKANGS
mgnify:CR=1 FL=1